MTSQLIFSSYYRSPVPQMHQGSVKVCEVVGEECEVYWSSKWPVGRGEVKTWNDARATRANVNAPC